MHITSKELSYIHDSMKNEELLTKLCAGFGAECGNSQLGTFLTQMAGARLENHQHLLSGLERQAAIHHSYQTQ